MTQPKTIRQWLEEIPIPEIRDRAICLASLDKLPIYVHSLAYALSLAFLWTQDNRYKFGYWDSLYDHLESGGSWQDAPMPPGVVNPLQNETK